MVRFHLYQPTGQTSDIHFTPALGGPPELLTATTLPVGVTEFIIDDQAPSTQCGTFSISQYNPYVFSTVADAPPPNASEATLLRPGCNVLPGDPGLSTGSFFINALHR